MKFRWNIGVVVSLVLIAAILLVFTDPWSVLRKQGMQIMDDVIEGYVREGMVSGREAYMKALDKERFERYRNNE